MPATTIDFARFTAADRLVVTTNLSQPLATITEAVQMRKVVRVLEPLAEGWGVPEEGVPVANIRLNFYQGEHLLGNVGLGRKFLTALHQGNFWSRKSEAAVYDELVGLLGLRFDSKKDSTAS